LLRAQKTKTKAQDLHRVRKALADDDIPSDQSGEAASFLSVEVDHA